MRLTRDVPTGDGETSPPRPRLSPVRIMHRRCTLPLLGFLLTAGPVRADESTAFVDRVAPILQQRCLQCHNGQKSRGGLNLSTRDALLKGGDGGPAVVPGQAAASLLVEQVSGPKPKMPKQGPPLTT